MSLTIALEASEVDDIMNYYLKKNTHSSVSQTVENAILDLQLQQRQMQDREEEAYRKFGVNNVFQLQSKFDDIVKDSNLSMFSAESLRNFKINPAVTVSVTSEEILEATVKYIKNDPTFQKKFKDSQFKIMSEALKDEIVNILFNALNQQRQNYNQQGINISATKTGTVSKAALAATVEFNKKAILGYLQPKTGTKKDFGKIKIGRGYKSELKLLNHTAGTLEFSSSLEIENFFEEVNNQDWDGYYPFYGLTPEQKKDTKTLSQRWDKFKTKIKALVGRKYSNTAETVLNQLGMESFFKDDMSGVVGIFGELQAGIIFEYLCPGIYMTGDALNQLKGNTKLGVDLMYNPAFGIQIKNYKGAILDSGKGKVYNISNDQSALNVYNNSGIDDVEPLFQWMVNIGFNKPVTKGELQQQFGNDKTALYNYNAYKKLYSHLKGSSNYQNISRVMLTTLLGEIFNSRGQMKSMVGEDEIEGDYNTTFYVIGGEKIIPTSQIYEKIIEKYKSFLELLEMNAFDNTTINGGFSSNINFSSVKDVWKYIYSKRIYGNDAISPPSPQQILSEITIHSNLRIYV